MNPAPLEAGFDVREEEAKTRCARARCCCSISVRVRGRSCMTAWCRPSLTRRSSSRCLTILRTLACSMTRHSRVNGCANAMRAAASRRGARPRAAAQGVAQADRAEALEQVTQESEQSIMEELAAKKARSVKTIPEDRAERDKALRHRGRACPPRL